MKTFLLSLLIGATAFAQVSNNRTVEGTNTPGFSSTKNYVKNPNCAKNVVGITASGGSLTRSTTTPLNEDSGSECAIDASASGQTYTWALNTFGQGMKGQNCEARFIYEGDASLYKAYINNGSTKITTDLQLESSTSGAKTVSINFPCGDLSAANTFVIEATSNSAAAISVAKVYVGLATNLSNVAQAQVYGTLNYAGTTNCIWQKSGTIGNFSADTDCAAPTVTGNASAPATKIPGILFNNLKPGNYRVTFRYAQAYCGSTLDCYLRISDGTTNTSLQVSNSNSAQRHHSITHIFSYTTPQSSITFQLQGGSGDANNFEIYINSSGANLDVYVEYFPSSSELALKLQDTPWYVDATMDGANPSLGVAAVTSFTEIADAGLTLKPQTGSQPVGVMCSSTNAATAPSTSNTTCAAGSESVGINFSIPKAGTYEVCFYGSWFGRVDTATESVAPAFELIETPTNAQTLTLEGGTRTQAGLTGNAAAVLENFHPFANCSFFNWSSSGTKGVRLMYEQSISGTPNVSTLLSDADANNGQRNMRWTVKPVTQQSPAPLLVGSVTSNSSGLERVERVTLAAPSAGACAVSNESGDWINGNPTSSGTGACAATINTGIFSATPVCVCNTDGNTGLGNTICRTHTISSTGFSTTTFDTSAANADKQVNIICMGQR